MSEEDMIDIDHEKIKAKMNRTMLHETWLEDFEKEQLKTRKRKRSNSNRSKSRSPTPVSTRIEFKKEI